MNVPSALRNLPAPAKINHFLHVTGRRADGYHLLETVFQFIDLQDRIDLSLREDDHIRRSGDAVGVEDEQDLCVRAARALAEAFRARGMQSIPGVDIHLRKRIPMGAGLGGGSSDAATVLIGLNRLWSSLLRTAPLTRAGLIDIGRRLGADVPVFIHGRNCLATGIGDVFQDLPPRLSALLGGLWVVLLSPQAHVSTPSVFRDPSLTRNTKAITIEGFSEACLRVFQPPVAFQAPEETASPTSMPLPGRNDLEAVVRSRVEQVDAAMRGLDASIAALARPATAQVTASAGSLDNPASERAGSGVVSAAVSRRRVSGRRMARQPEVISTARMSGSGASVFAVTASEELAGRIAMHCASVVACPVQVVAGLGLHPLGSRQVG